MMARRKRLSARDQMLLDLIAAGDADRVEVSETEAKLLSGYAEEHGMPEAAEIFRGMYPDKPRRRR